VKNKMNIPEYMKENCVFCNWRYEIIDGVEKKVPYNPKTNFRASSTAINTFADLETAINNNAKYDGIGVGVFGDIVAIDIDGCIVDSAIDERGQEIIDLAKSWTEVSPSGEGIRIFGLAPKFQYDKGKYYINNQKTDVEMYIAGNTGKYVTVTGNRYNDYEFRDISDAINDIAEKYLLRKNVDNNVTDDFDITSDFDLHCRTGESKTGKSRLTNDEVIEKALSAKNSANFEKLWNGSIEGYASNSEADAALLSHLAFWTNCDHKHMYDLFCQSGLYREKWNRMPSGLSKTPS